MAEKIFDLIENYIYLHHLNQYIVLPVYPDSIQDSMGVNYASQTPLARTAPIYSYSSSGPRSIQFQFYLHRDMLNQVNTKNNSLHINIEEDNEDYVDKMVKLLLACALPKYADASKMIDPPIVSVRVGADVYIKGIIDGQVAVAYEKPILEGNKYGLIQISFNVKEIQPYDAELVANFGSLRGLNTTLDRNVWRAG